MKTEPDVETAAGEEPASKLERFTEQLIDHLETRWEYVVLVFTEKTSEIASSLAAMLALSVFLLLALLFFSLSFAWWLGDAIGHRAGGFALTGLVFIPMGIAAYFWVKPIVREKIIQNILQDDDQIPTEEE